MLHFTNLSKPVPRPSCGDTYPKGLAAPRSADNSLKASALLFASTPARPPVFVLAMASVQIARSAPRLAPSGCREVLLFADLRKMDLVAAENPSALAAVLQILPVTGILPIAVV